MFQRALELQKVETIRESGNGEEGKRTEDAEDEKGNVGMAERLQDMESPKE